MVELSYMSSKYVNSFTGRLLGLLNKKQYACLMKDSKNLTRRLSTAKSVKLENFTIAKLEETRFVIVNDEVGKHNFGAHKVFVSGELIDRIAYVIKNNVITVELEDKEGCKILIKEGENNENM